MLHYIIGTLNLFYHILFYVYRHKAIFIHMKTIPPYFWLYTSFCYTAKGNKQSNTVTFDHFLQFINIKQCHYCQRSITWPEKAFTRVSNRQYKRNSKCYYLDRKDNNIGYSPENCVVCCTTCNSIKSNSLTYNEMLILKPSLIELARFQTLL
jgi:hypothetical protein